MVENQPFAVQTAVKRFVAMATIAGMLCVCAWSSGHVDTDAFHDGEAALDAKDYVKAEQLLAEAEAQAPGRTNALALRAKALIHLERFKDAERSLREYLRRHPDSPDACYLLGYVLFREDQPGASLQAYTAAARLQRPSADDFKIVGLNYVLLNDNPSAIKWLERSVAEGPDNAEAIYYLGRAYYAENSFDKAIACFERALQLNPHYVRAKDNLGLAYEGKNDLKTAASDYREAIRMGNKDGHPGEQPYINLADLLSRRGDSAEALKMLDSADQIAGKSERTEEIRGRIFFAQGRLAEAETELRAALLSKPDDGALHYLLGRILKREGKADDAEKEFAQTRKLLAAHSSSSN